VSGSAAPGSLALALAVSLVLHTGLALLAELPPTVRSEAPVLPVEIIHAAEQTVPAPPVPAVLAGPRERRSPSPVLAPARPSVARELAEAPSTPAPIPRAADPPSLPALPRPSEPPAGAVPAAPSGAREEPLAAAVLAEADRQPPASEAGGDGMRTVVIAGPPEPSSGSATGSTGPGASAPPGSTARPGAGSSGSPGPLAQPEAVTRWARPRGGYQVRPGYPASARRVGAAGTAVLRVHVLADGRVGTVEVETSAGHADLDRAAVEAVRQWRFEPGRRGEEPAAMWVLLPVEFRLR
jgi:protein TonB